MKIIIESHNIEVTNAIEEHVELCVIKLEHLNQKAVEARVHIERDHVGQVLKKYKCSMHIILKGTDIYAEDSEKDLYHAIDLTTRKVQQQLRKQHSKKIKLKR